MNVSVTTSSSQLSSSSRSGSSNSAASGTSSKGREGNDAMSPIDLELKIQGDRMLAILETVMNKSKIVVCLPELIANEYLTLKSILSPEHLEDLMIIHSQYDYPMSMSSSLQNMEAIEDIKAGNFSLKNRLSPEMAHLIYFLSKYPDLTRKVDEMIEEMKRKANPATSGLHAKAKVLHKYQNNAKSEPPVALSYLCTLEMLRDYLDKQLSRTAAEELSAKIEYRKTIASNRKLKQEIREYQTSLREEVKSFEREMKAKTKIQEELRTKLLHLHAESKGAMAKKVLDSERQMVLVSRALAVKKEMLRDEQEVWMEQYENNLQKDLRDEKALRAKRIKVQTQLKSWLAKYDGEMTDKHDEFEEIKEMYEKEKKQIEELEEKLAEQNKEYMPEMEERENEYQDEMMEKLTVFQREHAARVIQYCWREVKATRLEKARLRRAARKAAAKA